VVWGVLRWEKNHTQRKKTPGNGKGGECKTPRQEKRSKKGVGKTLKVSSFPKKNGHIDFQQGGSREGKKLHKKGKLPGKKKMIQIGM